MDIKIAFFNGDLEEEIYMDQPIDLYQRDTKTKYVIFKGSYMVLSNLPDHVAWFHKTITLFGLTTVLEDHRP